ncbi:MAG: TetR/AcrR family transcriptional regulator [Candidatus Omnitrophica bacterium]|nr:TetR/AcrR family transcriptional regulator [Candidatus Omnitrophota bacterium]MBU1996406.1 TetR/AcrR family transcriptional regulator [Candidatus Omnitrophota bacterium]
MTLEKDYSLREKKISKTKIALMNEFVKRLEVTRFNDISIKDVCDSVEVSEATFYNYFPKKSDLVQYFKELLTLKTIWEVEQKGSKMTPIEKIDLFFSVQADNMPNTNAFYELVSIFTGEKMRNIRLQLSASDKYYAFPDCEGIEEMPSMLFEEFLAAAMKQAIKDGIIVTKTKPADIVIGLMTIFVGIPLAIEEKDFVNLKNHYKKQLSVFWKGLGAK